MAWPYAEVIAAPLIKIVSDVLNRILPAEKMSEEERAKIQQAVSQTLLEADWKMIAGQLEINLQEAKSGDLFVSGWRPFVGWVCGSALAYNFVAQPILAFMVGVYAWELPPLPLLDSGTLTTILLGILGLGGLRSFEKYRGLGTKP